MRHEDQVAIRQLIEQQCAAALGTITPDGAPYVSYVLYAIERRAGHPPGLLLFLSRLSAHTRHLLAEPRLSLLITADQASATDPQALARITLQGTAIALATDDPDYAAARACYLQRLPAQEHLFALPDFSLFRVSLREGRYIGGFARAYTLDAERLAAVLQVAAAGPA